MQSLRPWILASRPKTLPAAVAPVVAASALAYAHGLFAPLPAALCLAFAILIQIGTNFANDYYDFVKGTDNPKRIGPRRAVAQGWIRPHTMKWAALCVLAASLFAGSFLVYFGGVHLVIIGLLSVALAILYTGGPFPLAYVGLGDVFVLIFFGWIAVTYTYFVQAGHHSISALTLGTAIGLLSVNLLLINNYRDFENDRNCGKRTTVVRFGLHYGRWQYRISSALAVVMSLLLSFMEQNGLLILSALPAAWGCLIANQLRTAGTAPEFDKLLKQTSMVLLLFALISAAAFGVA